MAVFDNFLSLDMGALDQDLEPPALTRSAPVTRSSRGALMDFLTQGRLDANATASEPDRTQPHAQPQPSPDSPSPTGNNKRSFLSFLLDQDQIPHDHNEGEFAEGHPGAHPGYTQGTTGSNGTPGGGFLRLDSNASPATAAAAAAAAAGDDDDADGPMKADGPYSGAEEGKQEGASFPPSSSSFSPNKTKRARLSPFDEAILESTRRNHTQMPLDFFGCSDLKSSQSPAVPGAIQGNIGGIPQGAGYSQDVQDIQETTGGAPEDANFGAGGGALFQCHVEGKGVFEPLGNGATLSPGGSPLPGTPPAVETATSVARGFVIPSLVQQQVPSGFVNSHPNHPPHPSSAQHAGTPSSPSPPEENTLYLPHNDHSKGSCEEGLPRGKDSSPSAGGSCQLDGSPERDTVAPRLSLNLQASGAGHDLDQEQLPSADSAAGKRDTRGDESDSAAMSRGVSRKPQSGSSGGAAVGGVSKVVKMSDADGEASRKEKKKPKIEDLVMFWLQAQKGAKNAAQLQANSKDNAPSMQANSKDYTSSTQPNSKQNASPMQPVRRESSSPNAFNNKESEHKVMPSSLQVPGITSQRQLPKPANPNPLDAIAAALLSGALNRTDTNPETMRRRESCPAKPMHAGTRLQEKNRDTGDFGGVLNKRNTGTGDFGGVSKRNKDMGDFGGGLNDSALSKELLLLALALKGDKGHDNMSIADALTPLNVKRALTQSPPMTQSPPLTQSPPHHSSASADSSLHSQLLAALCAQGLSSPSEPGSPKSTVCGTPALSLERGVGRQGSYKASRLGRNLTAELCETGGTTTPGESVQGEEEDGGGKISARSMVEKRRRERISIAFSGLRDVVNVPGDMSYVLLEATRIIKHQQNEIEELKAQMLMQQLREGLLRENILV